MPEIIVTHGGQTQVVRGYVTLFVRVDGQWYTPRGLPVDASLVMGVVLLGIG